MKSKFNITGMTCSSCVAHVEKAVNKIDGIKKVNVNLLSNSMIVEFDENKTNNDAIIKAVIDAGYGVNIIKNKKHSEIKKEPIITNEEIKSMKKRLIISICFLIPLIYLAMYHMFYEWFGFPIPKSINNIFHGKENAINYVFTQLLFLIPIIYVNRNYFIVGFKRILKKSPNMDSLIALGVTASTLYGIFAIYRIGYGLGHNQINLIEKYLSNIYFESAGTILTLITLGKYLETKAKGKTSDAISKLIKLAPKTAIVLRDNKEIEISVDEIMLGDIIVIKPGQSIPVDGIIIEGSSSIDQSSITGESIPEEKKSGDKVVSGTINKNGNFKMKATKIGDDTTLAKIIKLVEEASSSKAPISKLADKVSGIFVPTVILIALIATVFWIVQGQSFEFALSIGISVLLISCPCALGLATPVAIMVGTGKGAENGILIKNAESLELLHSVDTIVLDKTGTITLGKPKVTDIINNIEEKKLLQIAGSLEKKSEHPLADAILEKVKQENIELLETKEFISIPGRGVKAKIEDKMYLAGNIAFMKENNIQLEQNEEKANKFLREGKTVLYFSSKDKIIGIIVVADVIKEDSKKAIEDLKDKNIEIIMITGDNQVVAERIGEELGIQNIISEVLPQDKEKEIRKIQENGQKAAFVGDGINDSPALVKADVGLAIGSGTDIAIESADIVLTKNSLQDVVNAINLSRAVIKNIKMNLFWAFFYNCIGISIATGIFYLNFGIKLNPMIGAAAMSLSSVCVVTNALRLRKFKIKKVKEKFNMIAKTIQIEGMQCNHCKMTVEKALSTIEGIIDVTVNLENRTATIQMAKEIEDNMIKNVIEEAGFEVKSIN